MTQLACPFCGIRPLHEFHFRKTVSNVDGSAIDQLYLRTETPQMTREHWQHLEGCRGWLLITRNLLTGVVLQTTLLPASES